MIWTQIIYIPAPRLPVQPSLWLSVLRPKLRTFACVLVYGRKIFKGKFNLSWTMSSNRQQESMKECSQGVAWSNSYSKGMVIFRRWSGERCSRQNSKWSLRFPLPGMHTLYNPLPLSVGGTCEYDGLVTPLIKLHYMANDGEPLLVIKLYYV